MKWSVRKGFSPADSYSSWVGNLTTSADLRQHDQHHSDGQGTADAGGDLRKRHQLHPIGRGEDGDIAGAALSTVAGGGDGRVDRILFHPAPDEKSARAACHH